MPTKSEQTPPESEPNKPAAAAPRDPVLEASEKGYYGPNTDTTPDEHYTVAGVTAGKPTPETVEPGSEGSTKYPPTGSGTRPFGGVPAKE